jgi:hypothetical protein
MEGEGRAGVVLAWKRGKKHCFSRGNDIVDCKTETELKRYATTHAIMLSGPLLGSSAP